jgi:hypothetical protein
MVDDRIADRNELSQSKHPGEVAPGVLHARDPEPIRSCHAHQPRQLVAADAPQIRGAVRAWD